MRCDNYTLARRRPVGLEFRLSLDALYQTQERKQVEHKDAQGRAVDTSSRLGGTPPLQSCAEAALTVSHRTGLCLYVKA